MSLGLTTFDLFRLDKACEPLRRAYGRPPYLVGSAQEQRDRPYRDVDVRMILDDDVFDAIFPTVDMWEVSCVGIAAWLVQQTGLPIDFQYQRLTEATAINGTSRNPLGLGKARRLAGGGDATRFGPETWFEGPEEQL